MWLLPLLLFATGCDDPITVAVEAEPEEVETCEWLIPIGIELVNDYFYTFEETDVAAVTSNPTSRSRLSHAIRTTGSNCCAMTPPTCWPKPSRSFGRRPR